MRQSEKIGKRLKTVRMKYHESQAAFSKRIGIAQTTLSKYENDGIPNIDEIQRINEKLGINLLMDNDIRESIEKILSIIYQFYVENSNKKIGEKFLTKESLRKNLLCGYSENALDLVLSVLSEEDYIGVYKNEQESEDETEFVLMGSKGILKLYNGKEFPSHLSKDVISKEKIVEEFKKYRNSKYIPENEAEDFTTVIETIPGPDIEYSVEESNDRYCDKKNPYDNIILTKNMKVSRNSMFLTNSNSLIISDRNQKDIIRKNLMQSKESFVVFSRNEELLEEVGNGLKEQGYTIKVVNFQDIKNSYKYNPFKYINTDLDVHRIVDVIFDASQISKEQNETMIFLEKSLIRALILYIKKNMGIPEDYKNFANIWRLLYAADKNTANLDEASPLDKLFYKLEQTNTNDAAVREYKCFLTASQKERMQVVNSCKRRMMIFSTPEVEYLMGVDEINLPMIGHEKTALFIINNYEQYQILVSLLYLQMTNELYEYAIKECSHEYSITTSEEILAIVRFDEEENTYREKDSLLTELMNTPIEHKKDLYYMQIKNFYKTFQSLKDAQIFKEKLKGAKIEQGTKKLHYPVRIFCDDISFLPNFYGLETHMENMPLYGVNFFLITPSIKKLKERNENWYEIIEQCNLIVISSKEYDTSLFIPIDRKEIDPYHLYINNQCLLLINHIDLIIDDWYEDEEPFNPYNYRLDIKIKDICLQNEPYKEELEKGLEAFVGQAKTLDQTLKDAKVNTVREAVKIFNIDGISFKNE